eukprot:TRINITY_DN3585_c0_g1_i1.p1 TRINITY_DN3585_c0_g1~~TRINITY_DN3585_c0_g1_i1.p1  ORF type:complete len:204 (+),score=49.04 TRINITY_DN3585_c0_g1_i1:67-678(+)
MAADHPDLRGSIFYTIQASEGYYLPPGVQSRGRRAPTGQSYIITVLFFHPQDMTYIQQSVSVYHHLDFYQDYFRTHTLPEAVVLSVNPAVALSPDVAAVRQLPASAYEFDAAGAVLLANFKMREGVQNKSERMEVRHGGASLLMWKSHHGANKSWTEFFCRYQEGAIPEFVAKAASPYCDNHFVSQNQLEMYQEVESSLEYEN